MAINHGRVLAALLLAVAPALCPAGGFAVSPVRLFFEERDRALALRLSNEGDAEIRLQAELHAWSQDAQGRDRLEPSDDLVVSPTLIRVRPRSEQVVRLILAVPREPNRQMTYRLLIREDRAAAPPTAAVVPISLVLSLPVFVTPASARPALACELEPVDSQRRVATCRNSGTAHARVGRMDLLDGSDLIGRFEGSVYVLPGSQVRIPLAVDASSAARAGQLLRALTDGEQQLTWKISDGTPSLAE